MIFILGLGPMIWKCQVNFRGFAVVLRGFSTDGLHLWHGAHDLKLSCRFQGGGQLFLGLFSKDDVILGLVPMMWKCQVNLGGFAAVLRSLFKRWYSFVDWCPRFESGWSISGCLQLFSGLFSKDDIHSWTGAHDLKVSGQFFKDDIHSWTGTHDLKMSGQFFRGVCSCS